MSHVVFGARSAALGGPIRPSTTVSNLSIKEERAPIGAINHEESGDLSGERPPLRSCVDTFGTYCQGKEDRHRGSTGAAHGGDDACRQVGWV